MRIHNTEMNEEFKSTKFKRYSHKQFPFKD